MSATEPKPAPIILLIVIHTSTGANGVYSSLLKNPSINNHIHSNYIDIIGHKNIYFLSIKNSFHWMFLDSKQIFIWHVNKCINKRITS